MKILVESGDYREIIETKTDNRSAAHLCGCIRALDSGKELGTVIRSSTYLDSPVIQEDDLFSLSEAIREFIKSKS